MEEVLPARDRGSAKGCGSVTLEARLCRPDDTTAEEEGG